jgi:hypothetical protein
MTITSDPWGMWFAITDSSLPIDRPPQVQPLAQIPFQVDMNVIELPELAPPNTVLGLPPHP